MTGIGIKNQTANGGYDQTGRSPKSFSLMAADSADATEWTTLLSVTDEAKWSADEWRYWSIDNSNRYTAYKLSISAHNGGNGGYAIIQEAEFYGSTKPVVSVSGDPANFGDIDYNPTTVEAGETVTKTAFDGTWTNSTENLCATCTGYTLYTNGTDKTLVKMAEGTTAFCSFTMPDANVSLVWHFSEQVKVTVSAGTNGSVSSVDGWYHLGDVVNPDPKGTTGYDFFDWTATVGTVAINDEAFVVKAPMVLTANFAPVTELQPGTNIINNAVTNYLNASSDPVIFRLNEGTYYETQKTNCVYISGPVHVIGAGATPEGVRVTRGADQSARIFLLENARALVKNLTITGGWGQGNVQPGSGGGAAICAAGGTIADCVIRNSTVNTYNSCGGGLYLAGGLVSRCIVTNCQTQIGYGAQGGSGIWAGGTAIIENSLVMANKIGGASNAQGAAGGVSIYGSAQLINSTVVLNGSTSAYVGGVYLGSTTAKAVNTVVYGNTAATGQYPAFKFATNAAAIPVACVTDDAEPVNDACIVTDVPAFSAEANRDYSITVASPMRNAGTEYYTTDAASATDLAGNARISQGAVDIGAYEFQSSGLVCAFTASMESGLTPAVATFTATA